MLVFYVDDDIDDREMFLEAIKKAGQDIDYMHFESGQDILAFLATHQSNPDYIFIDINMPKMDGHECAKRIRENERTSEIPIVMYSTAFNPNDIEKFEKLGYQYLAKPHEFSNLIGYLQQLLN